MPAPKIDKRSYDDIVRQTSEWAKRYSDWTPRDDGQPDAGSALIGIFGRFMELVVDRLNRVPEKNYLAFLNLIGADLLPPQPARVPLTFELAANSPVDALVPAGTQVAAPPAEGEEEEVIFETDQELVVTRAQLKEVFVRNFDVELDQDLYSRVTPQALGTVDEPFDVFAGDQRVEHALYLACDALLNLPGKTDVTLHISAEDAPGLAAYPMIWSYWDGEKEAWQEIARTPQGPPSIENDTWEVILQHLPPLTASLVNGVEGGWLQGQLGLPLPPGRSGLTLNAIAIGSGAPQDLEAPFSPFGDETQATYFYLSCDEAFGRAGATVTLEVALAPPGQGDDLDLEWDFKAGDDWQPLDRPAHKYQFTDGTQSFTQDGQIRFRVPPDQSWRPTTHRERTGYWLRIKIKEGNYTPLPRIQSLTAAYWELPHIEHIGIDLPGLSGGDLTLSPGLGFGNSFRLDLSKDFYPFGEQPRFNDTFYLSYEEVIAKGGAKARDTITINLDLKDAGVAGGSSDPERTNEAATNGKPLEIAWEFWNGKTWQELGKSSNAAESTGKDDYEFKDGTKAFTQTTGQISFKLPEQTAPTTVNGEQSYWLRARLVAGHYGVGASYEGYEVQVPGASEGENTITAYRLIPANFCPPIVRSLSFSISRASGEIALSSCLSYNDFAYTDHTDDNAEEGKTFAPFTLSADTQPALYLGFDTQFDNRSVTLYAQVEPPQEKEVSPASLTAMTITTRPQVTWEYANPDGKWTPVGAFDETQGFARRGLIRFIGPRNFTKRQLFGRELYWMRARLKGGEFAVPPRLRRLLLNTTWASQATTVQNETLGSSNGNPGQAFQLAQVPVLPGTRLEVRESEMPSPDEQTQIKQQEGHDAITTILDAAGHPEEIWVRWHAVPDFHGSGPRDRHYTVDYLTGTVRFGDGRYGLIPPPGQNNIRAARYRSGGGAGGNRPRETVIQLKSSVPYIDRVTNFEDASGGADRQSLDRIKRYGPRQLRHRGRAVTVEDFEDLAYAASADVARAKAIPAFSDDGTQPGMIGLIVVPQSDIRRPIPSLGLLEQVKAYLQARCPATAKVWVAGPVWVEVKVTTDVVPTSLAVADQVEIRIKAALERFLHPLTGGPLGKGWPFGRLPYLSDLYALVESVEGVDHVQALIVDPTPDQRPLSGPFLIYSGQHQVTLVPE